MVTFSKPVVPESANKLNVQQYTNIDRCINASTKREMCSISSLLRGRKKPAKRHKNVDMKPVVWVRFNHRLDKQKPLTLKALLDSGGSGTLIEKRFVKELKLTKLPSKQVWTTPAGIMNTTSKARAEFCIPELHDNRMITWDVHVADKLGNYDMIIGRDILKDLGIDLCFSDETVIWDEHDIPFKDADAEVQEAYYIPDPGIVDEAAERLKSILDAKYQMADLDQVTKEMTHLDATEKQSFLRLLQSHTPLFDGTLGHWKGEEMHIELKEGSIPYHARAFPIPKVHAETLKQEVQRLCELGVLKKVNRSEWAAPTLSLYLKRIKLYVLYLTSEN